MAPPFASAGPVPQPLITVLRLESLSGMLCERLTLTPSFPYGACVDVSSPRGSPRRALIKLRGVFLLLLLHEATSDQP